MEVHAAYQPHYTAHTAGRQVVRDS